MLKSPALGLIGFLLTHQGQLREVGGNGLNAGQNEWFNDCVLGGVVLSN